MPYKNYEDRLVRSREYYQENKEKIKEYSKKNKHRWAETVRKNRFELKFKDPTKHLFNNAKHRAADHDLDFNLDKEDIKIPKKCPILGIPLFFTARKRTDNTPSIDRVNNSKGYVKGNIRVISNRANTLKSNLTEKTLLKLLRYIRGEL